jgi:hypothetical protein
MLTIRTSDVVKLLIILIIWPTLIFMSFGYVPLIIAAGIGLVINLIVLWAQVVKYRYNKQKKLNLLERKMAYLLIELEKYNDSFGL